MNYSYYVNIIITRFVSVVTYLENSETDLRGEMYNGLPTIATGILSQRRAATIFLRYPMIPLSLIN